MIKVDFGSGHNPYKKDTWISCDEHTSVYRYDIKGYRTNFEDNSVDIIRIRQVMHHEKFPSKLVAELARVLRAGGHVVVIETNKGNFWKNIIQDLLWYRLLNIQPYYIPFKHRYFEKFFFECGFKLKKVTNCGYKNFYVWQKS